MIIAVDFNGTICSGRYPDMGFPQENYAVTLTKLHELGHYIILVTCVEGEPLNEIKKWLKQNQIPYNAIRD